MATDTLNLVVHELGYSRVQDIGYFVLFSVFLIDGLSVPLVPVEVYLMFGGYLAAIGSMNIFETFAITLTGALIGHVLIYLLGYKVGHVFFTKFGKYFLVPPERFEKLQTLTKKYNGFTPLLFRFIPGIRPIASPLLGTIHEPFTPFLVLTLIGLAVWHAIFLAIGYYFGLNFAEHAAWIIPVGLIIVSASLVAMLVFALIRSLRHA